MTDESIPELFYFGYFQRSCAQDCPTVGTSFSSRSTYTCFYLVRLIEQCARSTEAPVKQSLIECGLQER